VGEGDRVGITPRSWTVETGAGAHHGVLHLGKRWYVVSAELDEQGGAHGVRLDGPYEDRDGAESRVRAMQDRPS
jgi:hypothetical protein